jgi:hypothetical protein
MKTIFLLKDSIFSGEKMRRTVEIFFVALLCFSIISRNTAIAASYTVTNLNATGVGSLYAAVTSANAAGGTNTITFDSSLSGTISFTSANDYSCGPAVMGITSNLTITGPSGGIILAGNSGNFRLFNVASGATLALDSLTITGFAVTGGTGGSGGSGGGGGGAGMGGAIFNQGTLTIQNCLIKSNTATGGTGGYGNYGGGPGGGGGGIYGSGGSCSSYGGGGGGGSGGNGGNAGSDSSGHGAGGGGGGANYGENGGNGSIYTGGTAGGAAAGAGGNYQAAGNAASGTGGGGGGAGYGYSGGAGNTFGGGGGAGTSGSAGNGGFGAGGGGGSSYTGTGGTGGFGGGGGGGGNTGYQGSAGFGGGAGNYYGGGGAGMGGAIFNYSGTLTISNSTLTANTCTGGSSSGNAGKAYGGALFTYYGTVTLLNNTISGNIAADRARGFYAYYGTHTLNNNIIAQSDTAVRDLYRSTATLNGSKNIIRSYNSLSALTGTITTDPLLGALASNGGPTQSMLPSSSSPAADAGKNAAASSLTYDQRGSGYPRFRATVDIGALEFYGTFTLTYTAGSYGSISGSSPQTVEKGADGSAVTAVPDDGYSFVKWSDDSTANPRTDTNVQNHISVTASFGKPPTVTTTDASAITTTTASSGGTVTDAGNLTVTARGICWNTGGTPTTSDSKTSDGSGTGAYASSLTSLSPGTKYYVRAYATNSLGTSYGSEINFTTQTTAPTVNTPASSSISDTTVTLGGSIAATGGAHITERGVYWSTTNGFTPPGQGTKASETGDWNATGAFTVSVSSIPAGSTIYYKAFAKNSAGTGWSSQSSFNSLKSDQTITFDEPAEKTYGNDAFNLTATASSTLTVTYASSDTTVATISGSTVTIVGAGSTTITASQAGNSTYNAATDVQQTLTVNKKTLTATADNKSRNYGENNPDFTVSYDSFVGSDTAAKLDTAPTASCTATSSSPANTYNIVPSGGSDDDYTFSYTNGTLTVNAVAATVASPSSVTTSPTSATLGGTISDLGGVKVTERGIYWSETDGFTPPTEGTKVSETGNWNSTGAFTVSVSSIPAGSTIYYKAYAKNSAGTGYSAQSSFATDKIDQTITFNELETKIYGDDAFDLTATASSNLAVSFASSDTTIATILGSTVTIVGAGTTTITASQAGNKHYNPATDVSHAFTVNKNEVTVTADNQSRDYGQANPPYTLTYTGFVNGDSKEDLDSPPIATCAAILESKAGTYTIVPSGGTDNNYNYNYVNGTLTINALTNTTSTVDASGRAIINNGIVNAVIDGAETDQPITLTETENGSQTLVVGESANPIISAVLEAVAVGTTVNVNIDNETDGNMIQIVQPSGQKINIVLINFPPDAIVTINLSNNQQIATSVTNQASRALDVDIQIENNSENITFTLTYYPPANSSHAKTVWTAPGGSIGVEASGVPLDGVYHLAVSYVGMIPDEDADETTFRLMRVNSDGSLALTGNKDCGDVERTETLGDYGVTTKEKKVWANVSSLGKFAVGTSDNEITEIVTTTTTYSGCSVYGILIFSLLFAGIFGLSKRGN